MQIWGQVLRIRHTNPHGQRIVSCLTVSVTVGQLLSKENQPFCLELFENIYNTNYNLKNNKNWTINEM